MAKLYFRYGAMNSGKTTNLLQVAHNYEERGMRVYLIKAKQDTKGDCAVVSRLGIKRNVDLMLDEQTELVQIVRKEHASHPIACILVDEAQFLSREQCDALFELVIDDNIPVICYGLRSDFRREAFSGSQRLMLLAHSIEELKTVCACGRKAIFNARKINGHYIFEGAQLAIDGVDRVEYESLCGICYAKALKLQSQLNSQEPGES